MEGVKAYLLSVTCAAVVCSLIRGLMGGNSLYAGLSNLLCGVFLLLTVVSPLVKINMDPLWEFRRDLTQEAKNAAQEGIDYGLQAKRRRITEALEAYILDKAAEWNMEIQVQLTLSEQDPPALETIILKGTPSAYIRSKLNQVLSEELGIDEENLIWKP